MEKRALDTREASEYIGMSESFLRQSRTEGDRPNRCDSPPFLKAGGKILYLRDQLDKWLESKQVKVLKKNRRRK